MTERHVVVLWSGAHRCDRILTDIRGQFDIASERTVRWERFGWMLARFYGRPLDSVIRQKAASCGQGPFTVIEVYAEPVYEPRDTTSGRREVNVLLHDGKQRWRELAGNPETVHASDDPEEAARNMATIGAERFATVGHALDALDAHTRYVVLRNWEPLPDGWKVDGHGDVDLLVEDLDAAVSALGALKVFPEPYRVHYHVDIGGERVPFDLRYVGDGYYDERWQRNMLVNREMERGFWRLWDDEHYWSLLYHALVHKGGMRADYRATLDRLKPGASHDAANLKAWMLECGYEVATPTDKTVPPHRL